jgi:FixJ family two-component response regulator
MGHFHSPTVLLRYHSEEAKQTFEALFEQDFSIHVFNSDDAVLGHLAAAEAPPAALVMAGCEASTAINSSLLIQARTQYPAVLRVLITGRVILSELVALLDTQVIDRCFEQPLDPDLIRSHLMAAALTGPELRGQTEHQPSPPNTDGQRPIVLIVDDEPAATKYLIRQLEHLQDEFTLLSADSAEAALEHLRTPGAPIAAVMTDQRMPGMQGKELLDELRQSHPAIIRILTSAWGEVDVALNAVNEGRIFRYQKKPWQAQTLLPLFREAIARHRELASALDNTRCETRKRFAELRLQRHGRLLDHLRPILGPRIPDTTLNAFLDTVASIDHLPAAKAHLRASQDMHLEQELVRRFCDQVRLELSRLEDIVPPGPGQTRLISFFSAPPSQERTTSSPPRSPAELLGQALNTLLSSSGLDWSHLVLTESRDQLHVAPEQPLRIYSHLLAPLTRLSGPLLEQQAALLMLFVTASLLGGDVSTKADGQCLHLAITLPVLPASGD